MRQIVPRLATALGSLADVMRVKWRRSRASNSAMYASRSASLVEQPGDMLTSALANELIHKLSKSCTEED